MFQKMRQVRTTGRVAVVILSMCGTVLPATAWAQASTGSGIAGVVRDDTGGVMPGVTVEAASPVLIEKVRTVITDDQGQYKILSLLPGTYTVTFSLTGFSSVIRAGIELTSDFTAHVDAVLKVGALAETVTVSGQTPVVDVQNVIQSKVVSRDLLFALPISKEMGGYAAITPGAIMTATQQDVGGNTNPISQSFSVHDSRSGDTRTLLDGMRFNAEGSGRGFFFNPAAAQEVNVETGGGMAEYELGGAQVNLVPKEGGNVFSGTFFGNYSGKNFENGNLNSTIANRGLTAINQINRTWDANFSLGGPIIKDKLWFFTAYRSWGFNNSVAGDYYNKTPDTLFYTPDYSRQAYFDEHNLTAGVRVTWQASPKNKFDLSYDVQDSCICHSGLTSLWAPETAQLLYYKSPNYLIQAKWSNTHSNKLLLEAAGTTLIFDWTNPPEPNAGTIPIIDASNNYQYNAGQINTLGHRIADQSNQRFDVSYVTGSHAFKTGIQMQEGWHRWQYGEPTLLTGDVAYTFNGGKPLSLTEWAAPIVLKERLKANVGVFAQDQWTIKRLTLSPGLRFDYFNGFVPPQQLAAGPFVPARNFAQVNCVACWKDIDPRFGAAYDLFGDGKTAVKFDLGRYVAADIFTINRANNPVQTSVNSASRTWNDSLFGPNDPRSGNYVPDCDLTNPALNGECGAINNSSFGKTNPLANIYAPDVLTGWGHRNYAWQASASVQQALWKGTALNVGYFRTSYGSFWATDNTDVTAANFDQYCVTSPVDSRLPGGGGQQICGLYDVTPTLFGQVHNVVSQAADIGKVTEVYNGVDVTLNARLQGGLLLSGGMNTGSTAVNNCGLVMGRPQITFLSPNAIQAPQTSAYCDSVTPWLTQVKFAGSYSAPWGVRASFTYLNLPGIPIYATYVATNAQIKTSLNRDLAAGPNGTVTIDLIPPNTMYENRDSQLDVRFSKLFRLPGGKKRVQGFFDIYNALNASPILSENYRYGQSWKTPTQILNGRLFKFGGQLDF